jgi:hypothetical protein
MTMANTNDPNSRHLTHLSEAAMNNLLIGLGTEESEAHVAVCPECRNRVEEFQSTVQAFHRASMAWTEFQSEARPESRPEFLKGAQLSPPARPKVRHAYAAPLGWALAAAMLLAIGIPTWNASLRRVERVATTPAIAPVAAPSDPTTTDSEAQIAQDNELLRSVNLALNSEEESPVSEYHLLEKPHAHGRPRAESVSNLRSQ